MSAMSILPLPKRRKPKEGSRGYGHPVRAIDHGEAIPLDEALVRENLQRAGVTEAERRVLSYLLEDWPNDQIAAELGTKQGTVRTHLAHVRQKLGLTRSESITQAILGIEARDLIIKALID